MGEGRTLLQMFWLESLFRPLLMCIKSLLKNRYMNNCIKQICAGYLGMAQGSHLSVFTQNLIKYFQLNMVETYVVHGRYRVTVFERHGKNSVLFEMLAKYPHYSKFEVKVCRIVDGFY